MTNIFKFAVLPALVGFAYRWCLTGDVVSGFGCGVAIFIFALYLVLTDNPKHPLLAQHPTPTICPLDVPTTMHKIKTALLKANFQGYRWRMLQFDADLGAIIACLDVLDLEIPEDRPVEAIRRQILLIAEFDRHQQHTRVKLTWRPRCGSKHGFAADAIEHATRRIKAQLLD